MEITIVGVQEINFNDVDGIKIYFIYQNPGDEKLKGYMCAEKFLNRAFLNTLKYNLLDMVQKKALLMVDLKKHVLGLQPM